MNERRPDLIRYGLARARECLDEARMMHEAGHLNTCINRLYYACFYAVSALLLSDDLSSAKHSGVRALFNREWVKTGRVSVEDGRFFGLLSKNRQEADYSDLADVDAKLLPEWSAHAARFVETLAQLVESQSPEKTN